MPTTLARTPSTPRPPNAAFRADPPSPAALAVARRAQVERRLDELLPEDARSPVRAAMRHALLGPGKRLRARLAMSAAESLGADPDFMLDAGCALEMLHAASLVLDDLPCMDDARLRRGRPATHVAHGEDVALLAAIGLLAEAFGLVATLGCAAAAVRAGLCARLAGHVGVRGLVGGQYEDLHRPGDVPVSPEDAERCNLRKTAALFLSAVEAAADCTGAAAWQREALERYALALGAAFQIADDLLDLHASPLQAGKDTGKDAGKPTLVGLLGATGARAAMHHRLREAATAARTVDGGNDGPLGLYLQATFGDELTLALETAT